MNLYFKKMFNQTWKRTTSMFVSLLFCTAVIFAQGIPVSGTITENGTPLPGVTVMVRGTTIGTAADANGRYQITVPDAESVLQFSFVGYRDVDAVVGDKRVIDIEMVEDAQSLDEVVVIGYGVLKKKLVTGATIQVSGESLQKMSTTNAFTALQSQTPGVSIIQSNGQPGSGYIVHIRGIGTNGEARPLYVVDGVPAGNDAMNHMSAADIESIDILKDAASAAIYGARGANGVVLITTKQGKAGTPKLSYEGYFGRQYMTKKPDLLNAKEYILIQNERRFVMNEPAYDWENLLPFGMYDDIMNDRWAGSDWVEAFYNKGAITQNHAFTLTGGSDMSRFSIGYSYTQQDGIFGEAVQSKYDRHTVRVNTDHVVLKKNDLDLLKIGQTLNYNYRVNNGIALGNMYWNDFTQVLRANPLMPIYNEDGTYYDQNSKDRDGWFFEGSFGNPIAGAATDTRGLNLYKNHGLRTSVYALIQPIRGLTFKSQFGYNMSAYSGRTAALKAYLSTTSQRMYDTVNQDQSVGYGWTIENILSYQFSAGSSNFTIQVGQSAEKWGFGESVGANRDFNNFEGLGWDYLWVNNFNPTQFENRRNSGSPWGQGAFASFWGRVLYNYSEKYIASFSMRSDGSSNFASGNRWGYFPAVSAGWIVSSESFMDDLRGTINFLKITASWGQNGNASVSANQYVTRFEFPRTAMYYFGDDANKTESTGATPVRLKNPNITWENQQMFDIGIDVRLLDSRLGVISNFYQRDTKDWLLDAPIAAVWGIRAPTVNGGAVQNKGVELTLLWNDKIGDFTYGVNLNGSYNKNEVTKIDNTEGIITGPANVLSQTTGECYRLQVGQPMGFFYGWKSDGIFQNQAEVDDYIFRDNKGNPILDKDEKTIPIIPGARPGDVRFRDIAGGGEKGDQPDGAINEKDKTFIGCGWPKYKMGFQFNVGYKGFDFAVIASGAFGMQIAKSYRSFADSNTQNHTTQVFERWHGEGTSNKWPRLTAGNHLNYQNVSDIFLEDADYVKIQNIILGYELTRLINMPVRQCRLYVAAQNLFTITKYSGMDPEVGFGNDDRWMSGIDLGYYPAAKTFLVGLNVTF